MEKQEAVDFIIQGLKDHLSEAEITRELSKELKAPAEVVSKFVAQVASTYRPEPEPEPELPSFLTEPEAEAELPSFLTEPETDSEPPSFIVEPDEPQGWSEQDYPDTYLEDLDELMVEPQAGLEPQGAPDLYAASPDPSFTVGTQAQASPASSWTAPETVPGTAQEVPQGAAQADPELETLILKALAKDRKESDIIVAVCERTGMSWHDAQRLVAKVQAQNRKKLSAKNSWIYLLLSIIVILAGLALLGASVNEIMSLSTVMTEPPDPITAVSSTRQAIFLFLYLTLGLGLILGGGVGLWRTLAQMNS